MAFEVAFSFYTGGVSRGAFKFNRERGRGYCSRCKIGKRPPHLPPTRPSTAVTEQTAHRTAATPQQSTLIGLGNAPSTLISQPASGVGGQAA